MDESFWWSLRLVGLFGVLFEIPHSCLCLLLRLRHLGSGDVAFYQLGSYSWRRQNQFNDMYMTSRNGIIQRYIAAYLV